MGLPRMAADAVRACTSVNFYRELHHSYSFTRAMAFFISLQLALGVYTALPWLLVVKPGEILRRMADEVPDNLRIVHAGDRFVFEGSAAEELPVTVGIPDFSEVLSVVGLKGGAASNVMNDRWSEMQYFVMVDHDERVSRHGPENSRAWFVLTTRGMHYWTQEGYGFWPAREFQPPARKGTAARANGTELSLTEDAETYLFGLADDGSFDKQKFVADLNQLSETFIVKYRIDFFIILAVVLAIRFTSAFVWLFVHAILLHLANIVFLSGRNLILADAVKYLAYIYVPSLVYEHIEKKFLPGPIVHPTLLVLACAFGLCYATASQRAVRS